MNNTNGINSFPYTLTTLPIGIPTPRNDYPPALNNLINENENVRNYFDNLEDSKKAEIIKNVKDFQSKEELERYLYHMENEEFR
ncbi:MAG: DUF4316 domain-containing protein [Lachnoclostridium sp.]|jgi:hypothetical protein